MRRKSSALLAFLVITPLFLIAADVAAFASETAAAAPQTATDTSVDQRPGAGITIRYEVTGRDIKFGQRQIKRMLRDRPSMRRLVTKGDDLWVWVARQFAGECTGRRYSWVSKPDTGQTGVDQFGAWHNFDMEKNTGYVTVKKTRSDGLVATPEQMWAGVVYELFNIQNDLDFQENWNDVLAQKITKEEYTERSTRLEYSALKKLSRFYQEKWRPQALKCAYEPYGYYWFADLPGTYEEWIQQTKQSSPHYLTYYEKGYDSAILNLDIGIDRYKSQAAKILKQSGPTDPLDISNERYKLIESADFAMPDRKPPVTETSEELPMRNLKK